MVSFLFFWACTAPVDPSPSVAQTDALVILLDTVRADHIRADLTPHIHRHSKSSWFPTSAWTPSPWTVPSVSAFLTGKAPWELTGPRGEGLPSQAVSLPERLPRRARWMISTNPYVTESRGFAQGFDRFERVERDSDAVELAKQWWAESPSKPRFLVVLLMDAHLPYEPSEPPATPGSQVGDQFWDLDNWESYDSEADQTQIRALYRAAVRDVDRSAGELLEMVGDDAVTAIVSDHGEELFEHGGFEHGHAFWEEITRIHAAIRIPGAPATQPEGLWSIQAVGQMLAKGLQAADSDASPQPSTFLLQGHPLFYRDRILHAWGVRTETESVFIGTRPHQSPNGAPLIPILHDLISDLPEAKPTQHFQSDEDEARALEAIGYQSSSRQPDSKPNP